MINTVCLHLHIESRINENPSGTISEKEGGQRVGPREGSLDKSDLIMWYAYIKISQWNWFCVIFMH